MGGVLMGGVINGRSYLSAKLSVGEVICRWSYQWVELLMSGVISWWIHQGAEYQWVGLSMGRVISGWSYL